MSIYKGRIYGCLMFGIRFASEPDRQSIDIEFYKWYIGFSRRPK